MWSITTLTPPVESSLFSLAVTHFVTVQITYFYEKMRFLRCTGSTLIDIIFEQADLLHLYRRIQLTLSHLDLI